MCVFVCQIVCVFVCQTVCDVGTSRARRPTTAFGSLATVKKMLYRETRCTDYENYTEAKLRCVRLKASRVSVLLLLLKLDFGLKELTGVFH